MDTIGLDNVVALRLCTLNSASARYDGSPSRKGYQFGANAAIDHDNENAIQHVLDFTGSYDLGIYHRDHRSLLHSSASSLYHHNQWHFLGDANEKPFSAPN